MTDTLTFEFQDYTKYEREFKCRINGQQHTFISSSVEFQALKEAILNHLQVTSVTANLLDTRYNEKDKLKFIEFQDNSFFVAGLIGALKFKNIKVIFEDNIKTFDIQINVKSRFDNNNFYFITHLLSYENPSFFNELPVNSKDDSLMSILFVFAFKNQLKDAYTSGLFKTYKRVLHNDSKVKGTIDIARNLKENPFFNGKVVYSTKEHTVDNTLNHLILHTYKYLKMRFYNEVNLYIDQDVEVSQILKNIAINAPTFYTSQLHSVINSNLQPLKNTYYIGYEQLRVTCLKILRNMELSLFQGDNTEVQGLLFYIPTLWEKFLSHKFRTYSDISEWHIKEQGESRIIKAGNRQNYALSIIPDFIFYNLFDRVKFILDAKFSPNWYLIAEGKSASRVRDSLNRMFGYLVAYKVNFGGFIFPTRRHSLTNRELTISEHNLEHKLYCFEVVVPQDKEISYREWTKKFEVNLRNTMLNLKELLDGLNVEDY